MKKKNVRKLKYLIVANILSGLYVIFTYASHNKLMHDLCIDSNRRNGAACGDFVNPNTAAFGRWIGGTIPLFLMILLIMTVYRKLTKDKQE